MLEVTTKAPAGRGVKKMQRVRGDSRSGGYARVQKKEGHEEATTEEF